jgi:hypothetical protein
MQVKRLAEAFQNERQMPIEIPEISSVIIDVLCVQDEIVFSPQDLDPELCRGTYYQYTQRPTLYAPPEWKSLIVFSSRLDIKWQRMVCCKELMHVLDRQESKTKTAEEVQGLSEKLLGDTAGEDFGLADFQAAADRFALYRALAVIFPPKAREDALAHLNAKTKTIEEIAEWVAIPEVLLRFALGDNWPQIRQDILDC